MVEITLALICSYMILTSGSRLISSHQVLQG